MRASEALVIEAKKSWQRLQRAKEFFFADLEEQMKENHRRFLDMLMLEERQRFLQAHPYQRHEQRVDQANGFYGRSLTKGGRIIVEDFAYDSVDEKTLRWFRTAIRSLEATGQLIVGDEFLEKILGHGEHGSQGVG